MTSKVNKITGLIHVVNRNDDIPVSSGNKFKYDILEILDQFSERLRFVKSSRIQLQKLKLLPPKTFIFTSKLLPNFPTKHICQTKILFRARKVEFSAKWEPLNDIWLEKIYLIWQIDKIIGCLQQLLIFDTYHLLSQWCTEFSLSHFHPKIN